MSKSYGRPASLYTFQHEQDATTRKRLALSLDKFKLHLGLRLVAVGAGHICCKEK